MSKLVLFFPVLPFYEFHLKKDVGLFVKYLSKTYFTEAEILKAGKTTGDEYKTNYFSVKNLLLCPRLYSENHASLGYQIKCIIKSFIYLITNGDITHVMFFHITRYSIYLSFLMKLFIKKTKIYIKLDTAINGAESIVSDLTNGFFPGKHIKRWLLPRIDLISVETSVPHAFLSSNPWLKNIKLIPNGLDDDLFGQGFANLKKNKVNIITTVGRLGSYQKNTELILSIIKEVDLQDWQVFLIGSIEKQEIDFQRNIDELYKNFPHLISRVHFIGNISDTATLYNYYAQSRIFLFPSRFEASAIAELEAAIYGNYIIATDVGAARDITNNGQFGFICPESIEFKQNETKITESILQQLTRIINNEITIDDQIEKQSLFVRNNFMMSIIIKNAAFKDWAIPGIK